MLVTRESGVLEWDLQFRFSCGGLGALSASFGPGLSKQLSNTLLSVNIPRFTQKRSGEQRRDAESSLPETMVATCMVHEPTVDLSSACSTNFRSSVPDFHRSQSEEKLAFNFLTFESL